jgi:hypothetical protein
VRLVHAIKAAFTIAGELADFDVAAFKQKLALLFAVAFDDVTLTTSGGSVVVNATIVTNATSTAAAEAASAPVRESTTQQLSIALGVAIESVRDVSIIVIQTPPIAPSSDQATTLGLVVWASIAACVVALFGIVLVVCQGKRDATDMLIRPAGQPAASHGKLDLVVVKEERKSVAGHI